MKPELEVTPDGEQGENREWRYVATTHSAVVVAGNIQLHPRWNGLANTAEVRKAVRLASAASALCEACRDALEDVTGPITPSGIKIRYSTRDKLIAALALVDGPQTKD